MTYDQSWVDEASCREWPQSWFFPDEGSRKEPWLWRRAARICMTCPVRRQCLTYALTMESDRIPAGIPNGVWGGFSPKDRHPKNLANLPLERRVDALLEVTA